MKEGCVAGSVEGDHLRRIHKAFLPQIVYTDVLSLIKISDDEDLQLRLRALCNKYKNIFCNELPGAPAKIPKFSLIVQTEK